MEQSYIRTILKKSAFTLVTIIMIATCIAQEADRSLLKMLPEIPADITEPAKRAEYLTLHFWDKFDFSDTTFLMNDNLLERCFVDYADMLSLVPSDILETSVNALMKKAEVKKSVFSFLLKISERYFYESESPVFDENKLIPFLQYALQSTMFIDLEKIRPKFLLESIIKNRPGSLAGDFMYTLMNGETGTLHSVNSEYTLLYFNDPECDDCQMLIKQLVASSIINEPEKQGKFKILMIYVNDDIEAWEKHAPDIPDSWIYSRDAQQKIIIEEIFNIKQFPTIYLLDKDKNVLLKDTTFEKLENYLKNI